MIIESYISYEITKNTLTGFINPCLTKSSASSPALSSTNKEKLFCYYIKRVHHIRTTEVHSYILSKIVIAFYVCCTIIWKCKKQI